MSRTLGLDVLPDGCIHSILKLADERTILSFQATSKRNFALGRDACLWREKLECLCGFPLPLPLANDTSALQGVFRALADGGRDALPFAGVSSNGSFYSSTYWLDNLFHPGYRGYCTRDDVDREVLCLGAYQSVIKHREPGFSNDPFFKEHKLIEGKSDITWDEGLVEDLAKSDNESSLVVLRGLGISRSGHFSCPVSSGAVSLGHVNWKSLLDSHSSSVTDSVTDVHERVSRPEENKLGKVITMEAVLELCEKGLLTPVAVCWGGNGEWVEFEAGMGMVKPIIWFHFFNDDEYEGRTSDGERDRRCRLSSGFLELGAVCQTCELDIQYRKVKRSLSSGWRNRLDIKLSQPRLGTVAFINLNNHEQIDEAARVQGFFGLGTNIDIREVSFLGNVINLDKFQRSNKEVE